MNSMKRHSSRLVNLWLAVALAAMAIAGALAAQASSYGYPYQDPYLATVTARLMKPSDSSFVPVPVTSLAGRDRTPLLEGRAGVVGLLRAQPRPAPLVFLIPGMGGTSSEGSLLFLAEKLHQRGFSTLTVPSTLSWQFVLSQCSTGIPGFTPEDARDLRRVMVALKKNAEAQHGLRVTKTAAVGYSLGGLNAAFVMKLEREEPVLGLDAAVLINAPLRVSHAIDRIDRMNAVGDAWSRTERDSLWGRVLQVGEQLIGRDVRDPMYFLGLDRVLPLTSAQGQYLIGNSFRQTLADTLFVSQQVNDIGLFKSHATRRDRGARMAEITVTSFQDYMLKGAWPFWTKKNGRKWSIEQFVAEGDLHSQLAMLKDPAYRLLHNQDDFLTKKADLAAAKRLMGARAVIYPSGGHVGNLWYDQNQDDLYRLLSDLL